MDSTHMNPQFYFFIGLFTIPLLLFFFYDLEKDGVFRVEDLRQITDNLGSEMQFTSASKRKK